MLKPAQRRDPAALPRLLLTLLALALLWPGVQLSELNLTVLVAPDNLRNMGQFASGFWPPAHERDFLELLAEATLQRPAVGGYISEGKQGIHSEHLGFLLAEMQSLARAYPNGVW